MHIYPAGAIGLDSPPELLETARNTIAVRSEQEKRLAEHWLRQTLRTQEPGMSGPGPGMTATSAACFSLPRSASALTPM
jgi:hypothetical protein